MKMMKNDEKWWNMIKWFHSENDENHWICQKKKLRRHLFGPGLIFGWELGHFPDFLEREKVES